MAEWSDDAAAIDTLVRDAAGGDAVAFAGLYDAYAPRLRRFLRHQTGDVQAAEDLLQQTFMKMIEALPRYRSRGLPFGAWVFRIARNLVIDGRRTAHPAAPIETVVDRPADGDREEERNLDLRVRERRDERSEHGECPVPETTHHGDLLLLKEIDCVDRCDQASIVSPGMLPTGAWRTPSGPK